MISRKYYLIQLVDNGSTYWLRKDGKSFRWTNHGNDKEYKTLGAAVKKAQRANFIIKKRHAAVQAPEPSISVNVVEVTFRPCNPELLDGFYEPVNKVVVTVK